jgi:hypothetical protein
MEKMNYMKSWIRFWLNRRSSHTEIISKKEISNKNRRGVADKIFLLEILRQRRSLLTSFPPSFTERLSDDEIIIDNSTVLLLK